MRILNYEGILKKLKKPKIRNIKKKKNVKRIVNKTEKKMNIYFLSFSYFVICMFLFLK